MGGIHRLLAAQFVLPTGLAGRWLIAPWLDYRSRRINRAVLRLLDVQRDDRIAEVGFGGGALLGLFLKATTGRVIGIDPSPAMVARAKRRFRKNRRLVVREGVAEDVKLPDASIDKACSIHNVYFWTSVEAGIRELARILRPGGRVVIAFEPAAQMRQWPGHVHGFRLQDPEPLEEMMRDAGFEDIRRDWVEERRGVRSCCLTGDRVAN